MISLSDLLRDFTSALKVVRKEQMPSCSYVFQHSGAPTRTCGRSVVSDGLCIFHAGLVCDELQDALVREVQAGGWLEGTRVCCGLEHADLSHAKMPQSTFEGQCLREVMLDHSDLRSAVFRSTSFENAVFTGSDLSGAVFDAAIGTDHPIACFSIDLSHCELGGSSFSNARLGSVVLNGIRVSATTIDCISRSCSVFEVDTGDWRRAAEIYITLSKSAMVEGDYELSDHLAYLANCCRHRDAIGCGPAPTASGSLGLVVPSMKRLHRGIPWMLHRLIWGYGLLPWRCLFAVAVLICVGSVVWLHYPCSAGLHWRLGHRLLGSIASSLMALVGASDAQLPPRAQWGRLFFGIEAATGTILLSMFLVALTAKYMRRS